jgi:large subunit ribosomal protein L23
MKNFKHYEIIKKPLLTEKSTKMKEGDKQKYIFEVDIKAEKKDIKEAIEGVFDVKVEDINTVIVRGKVKRVGRNFGKRSNWKKAYVLLKEGYSINLVEGV